MTYNSLREKISAEKAERNARYIQYEIIYADAWMAGRDAALAHKPRPMVVSDSNGTVVDYVEDGICGFAWVRVPGNTSFGKWLAKHKNPSPGYPKGLDIWISDYSQSYERKAAHARAMAAYLVAHGIEARAGCRLD